MPVFIHLPIEVDVREIAVFRFTFECVAPWKGAEEGIGKQARDLLLTERETTALILFEQRNGSLYQFGQTQSEAYDAWQEILEEATRLALVQFLLEEFVQRPEIPLSLICGIVGEYRRLQLFAAADGTQQRPFDHAPTGFNV